MCGWNEAIFSEPWTYKQQHKKRLITHISPKNIQIYNLQISITLKQHQLLTDIDWDNKVANKENNKHTNTEFCCIRLRESKLKIYTTFIYLYKYIYQFVYLRFRLVHRVLSPIFVIYSSIYRTKTKLSQLAIFFSIYWMKVSFGWCINVILNLALT